MERDRRLMLERNFQVELQLRVFFLRRRKNEKGGEKPVGNECMRI